MNRPYSYLYDKHSNLRVIAATVIKQVIEDRKSLSSVLPTLQLRVKKCDQSLLQELSYGTLRILPQLEWILCQLMDKPLIGQYKLLHYLLIVALYQLLYTRIPPYAVLSETVKASSILIMHSKFKSLVNGVLRQFQRKKGTLLTTFKNQEICHLHPSWLKTQIQSSWPTEYEHIIYSNNQKAPMWLRVNRKHHSSVDYLELLKGKNISAKIHPHLPDAIKLENPCHIDRLPGFHQGWVSVQDISSQICPLILAPKNGEMILDLCAAPGGKTTYILEIAPNAQVTAVDVNMHRIVRIHDNLQRLGLQAKVVMGDACTPDNWCQKGKFFDRILLDAPCSSTGVIRRHPDIKWLRREKDIMQLAELQRKILRAAWNILKPGGTLLYSTCSILPQENREQISRFLTEQPNAQLSDTGNVNAPGIQCFPKTTSGDGFFYAKMIKIDTLHRSNKDNIVS